MKEQDIIENILNPNSPFIQEYEMEVFESDFCLKHHTINKVLTFKNCVFEKNILLQYTTFKNAIRFERCKFKGQVLFGDETIYEANSFAEKDIYFNKSFFFDKICFDGLVCKGSVFIKGCNFIKKINQSATIPQIFGASIASVNISKSLNIEDCVFLGGLSLNASKIGIGLLLNNVKFLNEKSSINFIAADLGIAFEVVGCFFKCNMIDLDGVSVSSHANIYPKEVFQWDKDDFINSNGNKRAIREKFAQNGIHLRCRFSIVNKEKVDSNDKKILTISSPTGYYILIDNETHYSVLEGVCFNVSSFFDMSYCKVGLKIGFNYASISSPFFNISNIVTREISYENTDFDIYGLFDSNNISCRKITFLNSSIKSTDIIDFRHSNIGWIFDINKSVFRAQALNLNGINCAGGIFIRDFNIEILEKTDENKNENDIDLSFCFFGKNIEFRRFGILTISSHDNGYSIVHLSIESTKIGNSLILSEIKNEKKILYINVQNASTNELGIGKLNNSLFNFSRFEFNSFSNEQSNGDEHEKESWKVFVKRQLIFSEDIYIQFEKYFRKKGEIKEANDIYYKGRCANRKALKNTWGFSYKIYDLILKYMIGYGVKNIRLFMLILIFLITGAAVQYSYLQVGKIVDIQVITKCFLYSMIKAFPFSGFKDFEFNYCNKPDFYYNLYFIIHRIFGIIFIPLWIAGFTGILKKVSYNN